MPPSAVEDGAAIVHDGECYGVSVIAFEVSCECADASIACEGTGLCCNAPYEVRLSKPVVEGTVYSRVWEVGEECLVDVWSLPGVTEQGYYERWRYAAFGT